MPLTRTASRGSETGCLLAGCVFFLTALELCLVSSDLDLKKHVGALICILYGELLVRD